MSAVLVQSGEIEVRELRLFYAAYNLLLVVVVFAFYCNNMALFWILLELTTILSAVLIVYPERQRKYRRRAEIRLYRFHCMISPLSA